MTPDDLNAIEARVAHNTLAGLTPTQAEQALEDRANLVAEVRRLRDAFSSGLEAAYDEGVSDACDYLDTTPIPTEAGLWDESSTRQVAETLGERF